MPYIKQEFRQHYDDTLNKIQMIGTKGDLEYCIFKLMLMYMNHRDQTYTELHNATYAAQHCADEFRRRFLDKREDVAMSQNGDVQINQDKDVIVDEQSGKVSNK